MTKTYRHKKIIAVEGPAGTVISAKRYPTINRAKKVNRGNIQPPNHQPKFDDTFIMEDVK